MSGVYDGYDVRALWEMVAHENESVHDEHRAAWNRKASMLDAQIGNLQRLQALLSDAWRPDRSDAARAFAGQVTQTVTVMQKARQAAIQIRDSYTAITEALIDAKTRMRPLRAAYDDERVAWRDFLKRTPAGALLSAMPDDWSPSMGMPEVAGVAVMEMHRSRLDRQARAIMEETDQKVATATMGAAGIPKIANFDDGASPPAPTRPGSFGSGRHIAEPVFDPPPPNVDPVAVGQEPGEGQIKFDPGPFLAQTPAQVASPPVLTPPPPTTQPAPLPNPVLPVAHGPFGPPITRPGVIGGPGARSGVTRSGTTGGDPFRPTVGSNGVIGGRPAQSVSSNARRPITRPTAESGERTVGGGWRDRSYETYARRRAARKRDSDEIWPVAEGVPPILEPPPPAPPNDATPGVIGIDR